MTLITLQFLDCGMNGENINVTDKILIENLKKENVILYNVPSFVSRSTYKMPASVPTYKVLITS